MAKVLSDRSKDSLLKYMGLPLHLFEKGSFFQPYLPLQQIDLLSSEQTQSYVVGTTNQIFFHHKSDTKIDVLVNVETGILEFYNQQLSHLVSPTLADRRWMEEIVKVVNDTWNQSDPSRPVQNTYNGSDDYLRAKFEEYVLSLLSSMKHAQAHNLLDKVQAHIEPTEEVIMDENEEHNYLTDYGMKWLMVWWNTNNFKKWNQYTDHEIYEIIEPGHPGMGRLSIADVQNTLANRLRDLQLKQNLAPIRNTLSKAMSGGAKAMSSGRSKLNALWSDQERHEEAGQTYDPPLSPLIETTTQQAGRLFSNFSSFLTRKTKEFSQTMEDSVSDKRTHQLSRQASSDDDSGSGVFVEGEQMYPFSSKPRRNEEEGILDV
ncbi:transport protein Avl9-domain-containing protein [Choanephora cucurbitarum]|nr:transport protein Avl9-domain-containing protein [Choanephora cucurbitarum]